MIYKIEFLVSAIDILNANNLRSMHHYKHASIVKKLREKASWIGKSLLLTGKIKQGIIANEIEWKIANFTNNRLDADNFAPTTKALRDGLVDVGIFIDDDSKNIKKTSYSRDIVKSEKGTYLITAIITEADIHNE